ncbi:methylated-DNA--[protein]-cysteine S-methyltransferase [Litorilituus lipolyticus]|uniref:methylated-DNA--[protein]-cysteine S-methyltransferase n=1 Tax=Litorilituus lipolyticus TaxID=2491017 RepID=A0A502KWC7_9GAMM|nr:methylated-DNA--[protein]-cysteine S-methyltransferase [Litorilituus lipolyticus]TPH13983.1 methylated-DNA--[protein]-cysteine S-methyltransferase [Litorilituus lipolyticus]
MKSRINIQYYKHPYAEFILGSYEDCLCLCDFRYRKMRANIDKRIQHGLKASFIEQNDEVLEQANNQLEEFFLGQRISFNMSLLHVGTEFQKFVWHSLMAVDYGDTTTYRDLAIETGNKSAIRAVASANGANAFAIIVPCHRVIGSNHELVGYGGGLPLKRKLLEFEQDFKF